MVTRLESTAPKTHILWTHWWQVVVGMLLCIAAVFQIRIVKGITIVRAILISNRVSLVRLTQVGVLSLLIIYPLFITNTEISRC